MHPALTVHGPWPFVGRDADLDLISSSVQTGHTTVVVLCGPSGVGKSRLASEAAARFVAHGWFAVHVAANVALSGIPLGAFAPVLAGAASGFEAASHDPARLFESVRRSLAAQSGGRSILLSIDDIGSLDSLSLGLVTQLVASGSARLIATLRTGTPMPDPILSMWTSNQAMRVDLPPLSVDECGAVLSTVLSAPVSHRAVVRLHEQARGNPLYLRELTLGAMDAGILAMSEGMWQLGDSPTATPALHDLIRSRLSHLTDDERDLVERVATCQPTYLEELAGVAARPRLSALESAGIVAITEESGRVLVSLAHPQYIAAVSSSMSRLRQIDVLLEQAEIVAASRRSVDDDVRSALWRLEAGQPSAPELLAQAAHLAFTARDNQSVIRLTQAAIAAGHPPAEMLFLQGEATWGLGRNAEALRLLEAAALADRSSPTRSELSANIAMARASTFAGERLGNPEGLAVLDELLERHPEHLGEVTMTRAVLLMNLERAHDAAEALDHAQPAHSDPEARAAILSMSRAVPLAALGLTDTALREARAAVAHAETSASPAFPVRRAKMVLANVYLQSGDVAAARETTVDALHEAITAEDEIAVHFNELMLGRCYLVMGRLETAKRWFSDVISGTKSSGPAAYGDQATAHLALALSWQGKIAEAGELLSSLDITFFEQNSWAALARAWVASAGGSGTATASLVDRSSLAESRGHRVIAANLLHAASRLGSAALAVDALDRLRSESESPLIEAFAKHAAAEASGEIALLVTAGDTWESLDHWMYAAESFATAAKSAKKEGRPRDVAALQSRTESALGNCESVATPLLQFIDVVEPLTRREREVAALAAQGISSNEIAERLFLSPRTVNNHLQATYTKLGIRGRGELADSL